MKKILKKLFVGIIIAIAILASCGVVANYFFGNKITNIVLNELNKQIEGEINVRAVRFTLIKRFPNASIEFDDVVAKSSSNIKKQDFAFCADTFLVAHRLFLEFSIWNLVRQQYDINTISIEDARVQMLFDKKGENNFSYLKESNDTTSSNVRIGIEALSLNRIKLAVVDASSQLLLHDYIKDFSLSGLFSGNTQQISTEGNMLVSKLRIAQSTLIEGQEFYFDIEGSHQSSQFDINKCSIKNEGHSLVTKGSIGFAGDSTLMNLTFVSNTWEFAHIKKFLPQTVTNITNKLCLNAKFFCIGHIDGVFYGNESPKMRIEYTIEKANMQYENRPVSVSGNGIIETEKMAEPRLYSLQVNELNISHRGSSAWGNFGMRDFDKPTVDANMNVVLKVEDVNDIFHFDSTKTIRASITGNIKANGLLPLDEKYTKKNHEKIHFAGNLKVSGLCYTNNDLKVNIKNGYSAFSFNKNDANIEELSLQCNSSNIKATGRLNNIIPYLLLDNETLRPNLQIDCDRLVAAEYTDTNDTTSSNYSLPTDIEGVCKFSIGSLDYENIHIDKLSSNLHLQARKATFDNLQCNTMNGKISGSIIINNITNGNFTLIGNNQLEQVNVKKLFQSFDNFEQDFITSKNLDGSLTANLIYQMALTPELDLIDRTLFAESSISIGNGQLTDFEPIEQLSKFIDLDELRNIKFSTLQNDFVIKDNTVYIPKMAINSSAFNIMLSGKQKFEGDFEYHLQLTLDEFLSKKRRKNEKKGEYFGEIEDDGLGHTKLFLKILGIGDEVKISYDKTEAKTVMKEKIQEEKKEILKVFREEFGNKEKQQEKKDTHKTSTPEEDFIFEFDE